jgi:hypothetical protein
MYQCMHKNQEKKKYTQMPVKMEMLWKKKQSKSK